MRHGRDEADHGENRLEDVEYLHGAPWKVREPYRSGSRSCGSWMRRVKLIERDDIEHLELARVRIWMRRDPQNNGGDQDGDNDGGRDGGDGNL